MSSELENSGIRVAVGDCSVTERRRWRPPYQNRQNCTCTRKTLQTQRGRTHGAGCVRQWFRTAEPLGERRYENWNTQTHTHTHTHKQTHTHTPRATDKCVCVCVCVFDPHYCCQK